MRIVCPGPIAKQTDTLRHVGPVSFTQTFSVQQFPTHTERNVELYHALWAELHSTDMTQEQFKEWFSRVPKTCGCDKWLTGYLRDNPPDYSDFKQWGEALHNAVNRKLGKPLWPYLTSSQ